MIHRDTIYRWLLHAYPRAFRREFGDDIVRDLDALRHEGRCGRAFWTLVLRDVALSAAREHVDVWTCGMREMALRWLCGCTLATAASGVVIWLFLLVVSALFPPRVYATGVVYNAATNLPFGVYGAVIGLVIGVGQAHAVRSRVRPVLWAVTTSAAAGIGVSAGMALARIVPAWPVGYWPGAAVLGATAGAMQSLLLTRDRRQALDWIAWTTAATILALATVRAASALSDARPGWIALVLAFVGYPPVIGLVLGLLTVRPLTAIAARTTRPLPA
jgi:hypothetical protein